MVLLMKSAANPYIYIYVSRENCTLINDIDSIILF